MPRSPRAIAAIWQRARRPLLRDPHRRDGHARARSRCRSSAAERAATARHSSRATRAPPPTRSTRTTRPATCVPTPIAGEHPLTLYVDKREIVTLMTLGAAPEALAIGFLRNQRLVESIEEIVSVQVDWDVDAVVVTTRHGLHGPRREDREAHRHHRLRPGHGLRRPHGGHRVDPPATTTCASTRRRSSACSTPCACTSRSTSRRARCTAARSRRDPRSSPSSRTWAATTPSTRSPAGCGSRAWTARDKIFYTTGRLTSEMVIKAAQMQIPVLVSRSGLTKMGHEVATPGRHHDDRARGEPALPALHRRRPPRAARAAPRRLTARARRRRPHRERRSRAAIAAASRSRRPSRRASARTATAASCRVTHAAGVVTWIGFKRAQVRFAKGEELLRDYRVSSPRHAPAGSARAAARASPSSPRTATGPTRCTCRWRSS